jgi:hypothetical protein
LVEASGSALYKNATPELFAKLAQMPGYHQRERMNAHVKITQVNVDQESVCKELIAYLALHEAQALFLLGNLQSHFQPAFTYIANENNRVVGVCGYYPTFQSCTIFSESDEASKAFAQIVLKKHPMVNTLLGMSKMIEPAYAEFVAAGRKPINPPERDFFELAMEHFKPFSLPEVLIRPVADAMCEFSPLSPGGDVIKGS